MEGCPSQAGIPRVPGACNEGAGEGSCGCTPAGGRRVRVEEGWVEGRRRKVEDQAVGR